jgi:uncharacterized protein YcbK (DUF882 family)
MVSLALAFILAVMPVVQEYKCSVTSYFRTPTRNAIVGGEPDSKHLISQAIDCVLDHDADLTAFTEAIENLGYQVVVYPTHIHVQTY